MAARHIDLMVTGGTVVNHDGCAQRDLAIHHGKLVGLGDVSGFVAAKTIKADGLHILPGVIDSQVHLREPGAEYKEDLETGSRAAVLGGVTAVFEMPNTRPLTITAEALADKVARAKNRMFCDFAFYMGATHHNVAELKDFEKLAGCAGIKVFMGSSTGDLLVPDDAGVLSVLHGINRRAAIHSEDEERLRQRLRFQELGNPASHPIWRDAETARLSTERLLRLARQAGKRIHLLHVSSADELPLLAQNRDLASVEVTPHHLTMSDEDYARIGTLAQMNPPVRDKTHQRALWQAISDGLVDVLGSDHAPHALEEKAKTYPASPSGMPGVQTLVPLMLDHVHHGRLSLLRLVDLTAHGPARIFGIAGKGRIALGYDADLTIVDLKQQRTITNQWIASRCGWTPYDGRQVTGWPKGTMVRGELVMWDDEIITTAAGQPVIFNEALPI